MTTSLRRSGRARNFASITLTAAATLGLAAPAHADVTSFQFLAPSGNIGCEMEDDHDGTAFVVCKIRDHTWAASARVLPTGLGTGSHRGTGLGYAARPG